MASSQTTTPPGWTPDGERYLLMDHTTPTTKSKLAQALRLLADVIELDSEPPTVPSDDLLTERQMLSEYGMGKNAADARGILKARIGRSYKWRRSDIESAIQVQPPRPRPPKKVECNGDELDALIASGAVRQ